MLLCLLAPWPAPQAWAPRTPSPHSREQLKESPEQDWQKQKSQAYLGTWGLSRLTGNCSPGVSQSQRFIVSIASQYRVQLAFGQMTDFHRIWKKGKESWKSLIFFSFFLLHLFMAIIYGFFVCYFILCLCVHMGHMDARELVGLVSPPPSLWAWGTNLGCQALWQMLFLNVPSSVDCLEEFRLVTKRLPSIHPWREVGSGSGGL